MINSRDITSIFGYFRSEKFHYSIIITIWAFLICLERAIIVPTLWLYLKLGWDQETANNYYAATITVFNFSALIATLVFSFTIANKRVNQMHIILFANFLKILGNFAYFTGPWPGILLAGRLISGVGSGCESILMTIIAMITTPEERTRYILAIFIGRKAGLLIGSLFNIIQALVLSKETTDFLMVYNAPGLIMAILWLANILLTLALYPKNDPAAEESDELLEPSSIEPYLLTEVGVLVIIGINTASCFVSMCLESNISPVLNHYFNYEELKISLCYLGAAITVILNFFIMYLLSTSLSKDSSMLKLGGWACSLNYLMFAMVFVMFNRIPPIVSELTILFGCGVHVVAVCYVMAFSESMFTKLISRNNMQKGQGILRILQNVGYMLGPAIGGGLWFRSDIVYFIMFITVVIPTILLHFMKMTI